MDYQTLETLRRAHPAWRLLAADHASLIVSFLHQNFVEPNVRTLAQGQLVSQLEDCLFQLRERLGDDAFPRAAAAYLDEWAADQHGWLRKYYPPSSDEPHFDISPATEKAIAFLASLKQRNFVGTESRLKIVFELLQQIVEGSEHDPGTRIAELERRRAEIDDEITRIRGGDLELMDPTQVRERFQQMTATAQDLLADFREVEQNFRNLDRGVREQIATWEGGKGALLQNIFGDRDAISDSDQGKSFRAFWDFLMSQARQEELTLLLETVLALPAVLELEPDRRLLRIHYDWLEAGEVTQRTVARLSGQLRRYLDDQAWLENRRIMQLVRGVEQHALALRDHAPEGPFMFLDEPAPTIELAMERPLFSPPQRPFISARVLLAGEQEIPTDALYEQVYVDKARLLSQIRRALQGQPQVSLGDLVEAHPLEHGLAELVAYLSLASGDRRAVIDDARRQTLEWTDAAGKRRQASLPLVIFGR